MEPWQQERAIGVLQQAIAIEKEGKAFYQDLANKGRESPGEVDVRFPGDRRAIPRG